MVAMYCSLGRLKILINAPLSTPHVPISPAENPESAHHNLPSRGLGFLNNTGVKNEYAANDARTIPKIIFNISWGTCAAKYAPTIVANTLGSQKRINIFLFRCV